MAHYIDVQIELAEKPSDTRIENDIAKTLLKKSYVKGVIFPREK